MYEEFKLKNYTTDISAERSIMEIEKMLSIFKASAIMKEYAGDGTVRSIVFKLNDKGYKLPSNCEGVRKILFVGKRVCGRRDAMRNRDIRAYNISWRIIRDWLHAQLSIIASGQAQPEQIMLPYMWDGKRTLYDAYTEGRLQIEEGGT